MQATSRGPSPLALYVLCDPLNEVVLLASQFQAICLEVQLQLIHLELAKLS